MIETEDQAAAQSPPSEVPRPHSLEVPFAELRSRLMARGVESGAREEPLEAYKPHAAFERETDSLGNLRYDDPTDCEGMLRIEDRDGQVWIVVCDVCRFTCGVQMAKADPKHLVEHLLAKAGIPELFAGKPFDKGDQAQQPTLGACRQYVRSFKPKALGENIPAIALWGKAGRGKSHLISLMVETLIRTHSVEAQYWSMHGLLEELRDSARAGAGVFESRWRRLLNVPVLALDDLGAERMTDAAREWFGSLVDHRYAKARPLLVATNIPPPGWEREFGERTASRLRGLCLPFQLEGPDRRAAGVQASFMDAD